jgi:hypothetical protein
MFVTSISHIFRDIMDYLLFLLSFNCVKCPHEFKDFYCPNDVVLATVTRWDMGHILKWYKKWKLLEELNAKLKSKKLCTVATT